MPDIQIIPILRVTDVGRSIQWYQDMLGFSGDPFPDKPPYEFCILRLGKSELMLRHEPPTARRCPPFIPGLFS